MLPGKREAAPAQSAAGSHVPPPDGSEAGAEGESQGTPASQATGPSQPTGEESIQIMIKWEDNTQVMYKVKKSAKLQKIFDTYAKKRGLEQAAIKFLYKGKRLNSKKSNELTAEKAGLKDGDIIDAATEQLAGQCSS